MRQLPTGTVTFLFTDIEGSTRLLDELGGEAYAAVLAEHHRVCRQAWSAHGGVEVDTEGDAFFVVFERPADALAAAGDAQDALADGPVRVRMGVHTGEVLLTETGYVGRELHLAARIAASGHGGQIVVSEATRTLAGDGFELGELGEHRFKDFDQPLPLYQLGAGNFPPLKTVSNTNLPHPASSFVGRERELEEVLGRMERGARLVTLTGPGGSGKTRLAIEAAATLVPEYKAGVFWVGLAALRDPALVTETIAQTLGAKNGLADHIGERELLLLLDNLEQVIEAAPELSQLLSACPNLTLLATSRELLRIQGEVEYAVPPLAEPEAVSLFCERSQLDATDKIAELCARLDSLPLPVELAAARTKALSPAQILERLSQRLDLLKGGRDADPRQQTLRATIDWSYDLLSEEEQSLFRSLSVFAGGCTLEAAEEVADAELDTLQSLVEKSLLRFTDHRYWMLETIREYAAERLEAANERREFEARHFACFNRLAEDAYGKLRSEAQVEWLDRLDLEHDNLRTAYRWAVKYGQPLQLVALAANLGPFWSKRGHVMDASRSLDLAIAASTGIVTRSRATALRLAGSFALDRDEPDVGVPLLEESARISRNINDLAGLSQTLGHLSWWAALVEGNRSDARVFAADGLRLARQVSDGLVVADALNAVAGVELDRGAFRDASQAFEEALTLYRQHGDVGAVARVLVNLGWLWVSAGDYASAAAVLSEALPMTEELGEKVLRARANVFLGFAMLHSAEYGRARKQFADGLELHVDLRHPRLIVECFYGLAGVAAATGDRKRAPTMAAAAERALGDLHLPVLPVEIATLDRFVSPLRDEHGEDGFAEAWRVGRGLTFDEAVDFARGFVDA